MVNPLRIVPFVRLSGLALLAMFASCSDLPTGPADTGSMATRGVTLADWTADGYASASAQSAIRDIARTGANTLVIIVTAYQDDASGSAVSIDPLRTPTPSVVATAIATAVPQPNHGSGCLSAQSAIF